MLDIITIIGKAILLLFTLFLFVLQILSLFNSREDRIRNKLLDKYYVTYRRDVEPILDKNKITTIRSQLGEEILDMALKTVKGQKVLSNLYIPIGDNKYTEIDSISIGRTGIQVWEAKMFYTEYIIGQKDKDKWVRTNKNNIKRVSNEYKNNALSEDDPNSQLFQSPYKQNRNHIKAIRKLLRSKGIKNIKFFSGIALEFVSEKYTDIEMSYDERYCEMLDTHKISKLWAKDKEVVFTKKEVNDLYQLLKPYTEVSEDIKNKHIIRLKEKHET